ncbi:MAG: hypothetical protein HZB55_16990 [Deltaproteobacteria bacterium]|nr:hypothetical protein [Deltaproteobacteria bacterium]
MLLRKWLPDVERPGADAVIREARSRKVECAPVEGNDSVECYASTIDGAGAQALCGQGGARRHGGDQAL